MDRNNENSKSQPESNSTKTTTTTTSPLLSSQPCSSNGSMRIRQEGQVSEIAWQVYHSHGIVLGHSQCEWDGEVGTICYIGPVASSSQYPTLWYAGIVWQQPGSPKAKHNGTVWDSQHNEWVCHFQVPPNTTHSTTACTTTTSSNTTNRASFVKWSKLQHHLGHGLDLKLVQGRYVRRDCPEWETTDNHVFGPHAAVATTVPGQYKLIEFYGEAQLRTQQELGSRQLTTLSLRRAGLSHVVSTQATDWQLVPHQPLTPTSQDDNDPKDPHGSEPLVQQQQQQQHALQYIRKLDVAGNLISDWHVVADLLHLVPHQALTELNLSYNRLSGPILVGQEELPETDATDPASLEPRGPAPSPQSLDVEPETVGETVLISPDSWPQPRPPPHTMRHDQLQHLNVRASHLNPCQPFATVLEWLGGCFPQLQTLGLSQNPNLFGATCSVHTTTTTTTTPQSVATALPWLERLDVSECGLASLQDVWHALARLPRLASWNLMDNPLQQLQLTTTTTTTTTREPSCPFSSLQQLQLSGTLVETLSDLLGIEPISLDKNGRATDQEANDKQDSNRHHQDRDTNNAFPRPYLTACLFPALSSLRLDQTPLTQAQGVATTRSTLIARLGPQLQTLNGTAISDRERTDAERRFVRTWSKPVRDLETKQHENVTATTSSSMAEPLQPDTRNDEKDPEAQHHAACFWYLASQHHSALVSHPSTNSSSSSSGADWSLSLVSVTLCSHAPNSCDMAALHRRLPLTLTIAKLHALLARHYGLEVDRQELRLALPTTTTCRNTHTTMTTTRTEAVVPTVLDDPDRDLTYFGVVDGCTIYMHERDDYDTNGRATGPSSNQTTTDHQHEQRIEQQEAEWRDFRNRQSRHAPQGTHCIRPTTNEPP